MAIFKMIDTSFPCAMQSHLRIYLAEEGGATAIEYALIAAGIATVIVGALSAIGSTLNTTFAKVNSGF